MTPVAPLNKEEELDNIINDLVEGCFRQFRTNNYTSEDVRIAQDRFLALLNNKIREAKIEELKKVLELTHTREAEQRYVANRLATLENKEES